MKRVSLVLALVLASATWLAAPAESAVLNTVIKKGPTGTIASTSATFTFKAKPKKGAKLQCRLDKGRFKKCTSPASYKNLAQGAHTFAVRAKVGKTKDKTPATRSFTVDTVAPHTTILTGPPAVTDDHTPTFTFSADDPAATFSCRLGAAAFAPCTSPLTLPDTPDEIYTLQVRARDAVGNLETAPATRAFEILTPLTKDLPTAQAAAAFLLPDSSDVDVPASCGSNPQVDCPNGTPLPPADQLHVTAARTVGNEVPAASRFDVSALLGVSTLIPVKVTTSGVTCDLSATSANGATPQWKLDFQEQFVHPPSSDEWRINIGNVSLTQVDDADLSLSGGGLCSVVPVSSIKNQVIDQLAAQFATSLCAATGPDYIGYCPP